MARIIEYIGIAVELSLNFCFTLNNWVYPVFDRELLKDDDKKQCQNKWNTIIQLKKSINANASA